MKKKLFLPKVPRDVQRNEFLDLENAGWSRINPQEGAEYDSFWHPAGGRVRARINNGGVGHWIERKDIASRFAEGVAREIIAQELQK